MKTEKQTDVGQGQKRLKSCLRLVSVVYFLVTAISSTAANYETENSVELLKVKAAFVLNLARFVDWSAIPDTSTKDRVNLCFYQNNFLKQSVDTIRDKKINNKNINISTIKELKITSACDVVLIPVEYMSVFLKFNDFENLKNRITITDLSSQMFYRTPLQNKVIFRLKREDARLRFEVNKEAAQRLGINVGSELLKLGILVTDSLDGKVLNDRNRENK